MVLNIKTISEILEQSESNVRKTLHNNKIKISTLRKIFTDKQAWKRRDEFYSLFKSEITADIWWEKFMDNYYLDEYGIVLDRELK